MKNLIRTFAIFFMMAPILACGQMISGYVTDDATGEKLISARVFDPVLKIGAMTNAYGFFSIKAAGGDTIRLNVSYLGYQPEIVAFVLRGDTTLNIGLVKEGIDIDAVEITDYQDISETSQMSTVEVPIETIKKIPALMGEIDVIKALQLLPGVQSGSEGSSGFYVRGGGPDQNLILLDGVPIYNVSHLFGFFSVFPASAINNVTLIKGGFPARYGGRLSSVLDISLKEGNNKEFHGEASIGIIASKLTLEGPIIKDKTSFMVSARRTYIDLLTQPFIKAQTNGNSTGGYFFYDAVAKVNHKFSDKDRLYLSFYGGRDKFYLRDRFEETFNGVDYYTNNEFKLGWGNVIAAARWNHLFSSRLFSNSTLTFSNYNFNVDALLEDGQTSNGVTEIDKITAKYDSGIRDFAAKMDFDFFANSNHLVRFGAYGTHHTFTPGVTVIGFASSTTEFDTTFGNQLTYAVETGVYVEDDIKLGSRHKVNVGLHASGFFVDSTFYRSIQPRLSWRTMLDAKWALKGSVASMYQYIHLLTNSNVGLPTDLWVPTTGRIRPQSSWQGALGLTRNLMKNSVEFSLEGYYKYMTGLTEYKDGAAFLELDNDWQNKVVQGDGWSYGLEMLLQRKRGRTNGWIGYTLSWTNRKFAEINNGKVFPYKYDRRHDVSVVVTHKFTDRIDGGLTWVFGTGNAITLPIASYNGMYPTINDQLGFGSTVNYIESRNSFRMRPYHRLDLGINFNSKRKWWDETWSFSVYNVYSRRNPYFLYFDTNYQTNKPELKQVSLFPIIPSVSYTAKF